MSDTRSVEPHSTNGLPLVRLTDVTKTYHLGSRRIDALRGLSLEIDQPGFYAIMGASGSGKSTLLHLLAGLDKPDSGEVTVAGRRLDQLGESQLTVFRRREVGIVFQQFNLIPTLTALENVTLPGVLDGRPAAELRNRGLELLTTLGLADRADHRPDAMSGGEQQRAAIARALLFEPRVLLADEPTGNLDSRSSEQMWALLNDLAKTLSMTVIMVTHEPAAAVNCRRVFVIRDGVIAGSFDVEEKDAGELAAGAQQLGR